MPTRKKDAPSLVRDKCGGAKPNGVPCGLPAGWGTDHPGAGPCAKHFGNTRANVKGSAIAQGVEIGMQLKGMGVEKDIDPIDALVWDARLTAGIVEWHKSVIDTWITRREDGSAIPLDEEQEAFYARFLAERTHLAQVARMAISANVEERSLALSEAQGDAIATAVETILDQLGLDPEQWERVPEVVPPALRAVAVRLPAVETEFQIDDPRAIAARSGGAPREKLPRAPRA